MNLRKNLDTTTDDVVYGQVDSYQNLLIMMNAI